MKRNTIIFILLLLCTHSILASNKIFSKYANQALEPSAKPTKMITKSTIFILHPLVKEKESKYLFTSTLSWKGNICTAQVTSLKTLKGKKPRRKNSLKRATKFNYPPKKLKILLTKAIISNWRKAGDIKLEKRTISGYRFSALIDGVKRDAAFGIKNGKIEAIILGFPNSGISHTKNMKDSGTIWHFGKSKNGKLRLIREFSLIARKSNGIPFVKRKKTDYSNF